MIAIFTWKNKYSSFLSLSKKGVVTDDNDKDDEQRKLTTEDNVFVLFALYHR